ncbi:putative alkaline phosphatase domain-containing protein [Magnetofaba australis IT-1]|uniref:Putative alkaline phosphatase domain-containing protein n=1 Tax=Magnetofaba australis IT-1 TaxID=1434232 RepID=A0A1Y2K7K6_9PROT|nr:putative alkaline phosphatase domain-containing protein [Magnetofaba australis IT-1]
MALREALVNHGGSDEVAVFLTSLDEKSLGLDVLARLWNQRIYSIQSWRIVRDLFAVDEIDARLDHQGWMADALLQAQPKEGFPPIPGQVLTADFAWQLLLRLYLGFDQRQVDAIELARWAKDASSVETYLTAPMEFRKSLPDWIALSAGDVGRIMLMALEEGHGKELLPLGLVCQVIFDASASGEAELATAAARLEERFLGGSSLKPEVGRGWGAAVSSVMEAELAKRELHATHAFQRRAEEILADIKADAFVAASPILPKGFERRLDAVASTIVRAISAKAGKKTLENLEGAAQFALDHRMAGVKPNRADSLKMAVRLVRWLEGSREHHVADSFPEAVEHYFSDSGFVDWARARIWDGDSNPELSKAYAKLANKVDEAREEENRRFGQLIAQWSTHAAPSTTVLWIEELLDRVVAPLAKDRPALLLVLDGMSVAVFRELLQDLHSQGWVELGHGEVGERKPVVAALPTRTEISRASLLCGQLTSGNSAKEKEGFKKHEGLRSISSAKFPPILYHKAELTESGGRGLSQEVRSQIAGTERRVIGVVINTVDDYLAKGGQFKESWTSETIVPLSQVLDAARESNRTVIITSDHGHVLERDLEYRAHEQSQERSRPVVGDPDDEEVIITGPRVWPEGERLIAPWSEKIRYATKKYGYHGGVSPQEVVVPLAVLHSGTQTTPEDWTETTSAWPAWWDKMEPEQPKPAAKKSKANKRVDSEPSAPNLFSGVEESLEESLKADGWIAALLLSEVYQEQKSMGARVALDDAKVRSFLVALDARGGKMTRAGLAKALEAPRMRFPGMLAALRRILNVDGFPILEVDENSDMVELDKKLLTTQFELKGPF